MTTILIILALYLLFAFLIRLRLRHHQATITRNEIFAALAIKILLGCAYGYVFLKYYGGDDTWMFHNQSLQQYQLLMTDPLTFFSDLSISDASEGAVGTWQLIEFYIMDLEIKLLPKLLALFNLVSRGNYYVNVVFFNALVFWGHFWLFATFTDHFPSLRKTAFLTIFFYLPAVFWLSGIRSDGLLFFFLALAIRSVDKISRVRTYRSIGFLIIALAGITIFRNVWLLLVAIPLVAWFISERSSKKRLLIFGSSYLLATILFFGSSLLPQSANLPAVVVARQASYFNLKGNTRFELDTLTPNLPGFARVAPQSLLNTYVRPYIWEAKGPLQLMASAESLLILILFGLMLIRASKERNSVLRNPMVIALLGFAVTLYLFIGFTVPFPGAIVRYKVIGTLFIVLTLLSSIKWRTNKL
ncbi:MAG: hypothetical protein H7Y31_17555 [Chitinophagaceae bacterium]|nr:hypothetical protein [Chitinophagaceae bacterium]